ncbi:MAG: DtxR family transcriptional regulator [Bacteroidetes bacterium QS_8_68_15]|nr:MAG: DtxR family transcriptional regulator [Bacteroidetes bacterium QS_8_68_15]
MPPPPQDPSSRFSPSTEDYLKAIYKLEDDGPVATKALAQALDIAPPSVTEMTKRLAERGLVEREPYKGATLTRAGTKMALEVLRHHRLLELYFKEVMDYSWDELHEEAEQLEHHISETFEEKIDELLGFPARDPHGHPIPSRAADAVEDVATRRLADLEEGDRAVVCHLADDDPALLEHLEERDLLPSAKLDVEAAEAFDGPLTVRVEGREPQIVGRVVAQSVFVRPM